MVMFLLFLSGCVNERYVYISSNVGFVMVKGDIDYVDIINCTVKTSVFNGTKGFPEDFDGFIYANSTMFYRVSGVAESKINYTLSMVNITVRFYRTELKDLVYVYSGTYTKTMVKPNETWGFSIDFTRGKEGFGRVDRIDIKISIVE